GTISPLHQDPQDNILCQQVKGVKYVRLYGVEATGRLKPGGANLSNTSSLEIDLDLSAMPNIFTSPATPPALSSLPMELILHQGDALFIPAGVWHYVRSLSSSISVNFWWTSKAKPCT
ncbi:hypothetical protein GUITHDRAFT_63031, partial [Guillardia theta CCMP2712]